MSEDKLSEKVLWPDWYRWLSLHSALLPLLPCFTLRTGQTPVHRKPGLLNGRFAEESPLTGYEPDAPVEVSSTEVAPTSYLQGKEALDRLGVFQKCEAHERCLGAPKFEDRFEEETLQQERCARRDAREIAKHVHQFKDEDKATFYSPSEVWSHPALSSTNPDEK